MFTIFRRIRQKLLGSGSLTKYLLYAIGEILLVVIGILIALQVNNWNEQRIQDQQTEVLIDAIHDEFVTVNRELEDVIQRKELMIARLDTLINLMGKTAPSLSRIEANSLLTSITSNVTADVGNPVLNNALQNGGIYWIRDPQLKTLLTGWEAEKIDLLLETERYVINRSGDFFDLLTEQYELPNSLYLNAEQDNPTFDLDHNQIFTNLKLKNLVVLKKSIMEFAIIENRTLLDYSEQIIERTQ